MDQIKESIFVFEKNKPSQVNEIKEHNVEFWFHNWRQNQNAKSRVYELMNQSISDTLFDENVRSHFIELDKEKFLIFLRGINFNHGQDPEDMVSLRMYFDGKKLITVTNRRMESLHKVYLSLQESDSFLKSSSDVFIEIISQVLTRIEHYVDKMTQEIENIEDEFDEHGCIEQFVLHDLKRKASKMWRHLLPQQETLRKLSVNHYAWEQKPFKHHALSFYDFMCIQIEEIKLIRERCEILDKQIEAKTTEKINKNIYVISIITVIFVPLSFVTGLFGINIGGMPGVDNTNAFMIFSLVTFAIVVIQVLILKFFKWF